jgi:hypothetical protein
MPRGRNSPPHFARNPYSPIAGTSLGVTRHPTVSSSPTGCESRADNPTGPLEVRGKGWIERVAVVKIPAILIWPLNAQPERFQGKVVEVANEASR